MLNTTQAEKAYIQWRQFIDHDTLSQPAAWLYSGMVYKKLGVHSLLVDEQDWLQKRLVICSFAYGLLRPRDAIRPYRLEGAFNPRWSLDCNIFHYWRDVLTDHLIERVRDSGGILCYLASEEMKSLFHWTRVEEAVRVISPRFLVEDKTDKLKQIVIYTKMARGAMLRAAVQERIDTPEALLTLSPEGYVYSSEHSELNIPTYLLSKV